MRRRARTGAPLAALACALAGAGSTAAQEAAAAPALPDVAVAVAGYWSMADAEGLAAMAASGGVTLHLDGQGHAGLSSRQVRAALHDFLSGRRGGSVSVERAVEAGGSPPEAFVELRWRAVPEGTIEPLVYMVFVGLVREGPGWRVTEIRVLR